MKPSDPDARKEIDDNAWSYFAFGRTVPRVHEARRCLAQLQPAISHAI